MDFVPFKQQKHWKSQINLVLKQPVNWFIFVDNGFIISSLPCKTLLLATSSYRGKLNILGIANVVIFLALAS